MPPREAGKLTRQQANHLYGRPREKNGLLTVYGIPGTATPAPADPKELFRQQCRRQAVSEERIAVLWEEARRKQADVRRQARERQEEITRKRDEQRRKNRGR